MNLVLFMFHVLSENEAHEHDVLVISILFPEMRSRIIPIAHEGSINPDTETIIKSLFKFFILLIWINV